MSEKTVVQRSHEAVQKEVSAYNDLFKHSTSVDERKIQYKTLVTNYYSLSTDFYEYGWGQSFHFANRLRGETFTESIQRHESYLALKAKMKSGDQVLDIGCGVGGPLRRIAYLTEAHLTGLTMSEYQIQRAKRIGTIDEAPFFFLFVFDQKKMEKRNLCQQSKIRFQVYRLIASLSKVISCSYPSKTIRSIMSM